MSPPKPMALEVAVATARSAATAESAGAARVELCASLIEGGVTPSLGLLQTVRRTVKFPIHVLIRPRGGDFLFDAAEIDAMLADIRLVREAGADGVVVGALDPEGNIDAALTALLIEVAQPLDVTFHRAFDLARDPAAALETLIALGVDRVLTSGQAPTALEGIGTIRALVGQAAGRIAIMAGGSVTPEAAARLVAETGVQEIHVGGGGSVESAMTFRREGVFMGKAYQPDEYRRAEADAGKIRALARALSR